MHTTIAGLVPASPFRILNIGDRSTGLPAGLRTSYYFEMASK